MSIVVMSWVFEHSEETLGNRLVLLALAEFAHDDGSESFPTIATLMKRTRLSERQVQYSLRALESNGAITKTGQHPSGVNRYAVVLGGGAESAPGGVQSTAPEPLEPFVGSEPKGSSPTRRRTNPRPRDALWDVLVEAIGDVTNELERGRRNKALRALRESEATPDQVRRAVVIYRQRWPAVELTALALASNWAVLTANGKTESREDEMRRLEARAKERGVL